MTLRYDIEEMVEDAFVRYLDFTVRQTVSMKVYAAFDTDVIQFPCVVVRAAKAGKIDPKGAWSTSRSLMVDVAVLVEAVKTIDDKAVVISGAREQNRNCRNAVVSALSIEDTDAGPADFASSCQCDNTDQPKGLAAYLTYQKIPGIWIKFAQVTDCERDIEEDRKCLKSLISVAVIAQPVQIGGY